MTIGKLPGMLMALLVATGVAGAPLTCADCKATALAAASQCRAQAAPDSDLLASCDKSYAEMTQGCPDSACRAEAAALGAAQCSDCAQRAETEIKKCAALPGEVRAACDARAAGAKKSCEEKFCPPPKTR